MAKKLLGQTAASPGSELTHNNQTTRVETSLQQAISKVESVLAERKRIQEALRATGPSAELKRKEYEQAARELSREEACQALGEQPGTERPALKRVIQVRIDLEALDARKQGLQSRMVDCDTALLDHEKELNAARYAWSKILGAQFREEYLEEVNRMRVIILRCSAYADAVGDASLENAVRGVVLLDPDDSNKKLISTHPFKFHEGAGRSIPCAAWKDDTVAQAVYAEYAPPKELADSVNHLTTDIRKRREQAAAEERRRRYESEDRPKTGVFFRDYGEQKPALPATEILNGRR